MTRTAYDVVIVGGGHNGLVAAAYLAQAGLSVLVLERRAELGGAVLSARVFEGVDAQLSRYSYLLSLFPARIMDDLGLRIETRRRLMASFTPNRRDGQIRALMVSNVDEATTRRSFQELTGGDAEYAAFQRFNQLLEVMAQRLWPTLLKPLMSRKAVQRLFDDAEGREAWRLLIEEPLGAGLERLLKDDLVRGLAFTNAKIGALTHAHDESLLQNRTHLYHIIGQGTGEWRVVVGGMGAVSTELTRSARSAGAILLTSALVDRIHPGPKLAVEYQYNDQRQIVDARYVLVNAAPAVLKTLVPGDLYPAREDEGSVFKVNMLLRRLPRLKVKGVTPQQAFTGTFHLDEGYAAMEASYRAAAAGQLPGLLPGELYCQTMTDASTLAPELASSGYHTITLFGIDLPARLFRASPEATRQTVLERYVQQMNQYLDEPLETCLALDGAGRPCIEAKSPLDLEAELAMPAGHIFHNDLAWPFAERDADIGTWGVDTGLENIFLCGSGAVRGGAVSGIPGHNAAMQVLDSER